MLPLVPLRSSARIRLRGTAVLVAVSADGQFRDNRWPGLGLCKAMVATTKA